MLAAGSLQASIVFQDDFSTDPASNGYVEFTSETNATITSNGSEVFFDRSTTGPQTDFTITRTVDTTGFTDITVELVAFQTSTQHEPEDFLAIQIDTGSGFVDVLRDTGIWSGIQDTSTGPSNAGFNATPTSTGTIALSALAAENATLQIRIAGNINSSTEGYLLDQFTVNGVSTIPEPSTWISGLAIAALGLLVVNRRRTHK